MIGVRIGTWEPGTPEWHAARATRLGGSEIGTALGWNPWQTRNELLAVKRGEAEPRPGTKATERGTWLEAAVADWLADRYDLTYDDDLGRGTYAHPDLPWASFNPDRITTGLDLVEIKTAAEKDPEKGWGRQRTSEVPLTYQAQAMWGLHVLGLAVCHFGVLFGKPFEFAYYKIKYDAEVAAHLVNEGARFMADMQRKELPDVA